MELRYTNAICFPLQIQKSYHFFFFLMAKYDLGCVHIYGCIYSFSIVYRLSILNMSNYEMV